jgi:carboxylate-amine ligase
MEELIELVAEDAEHFDCVAEVERVREIVRVGTSADRQLARFEAVKQLGGTEQAALVAVVDGIIDDTMLMPG